MEIADTLSFLLGEWRLDRRLEDHLSGTSGVFAGQATLAMVTGGTGPASAEQARHAEQARYEESGELTLGPHRGLATRSLLYVRRDDSRVLLQFTSGLPFVDLDLRAGTWQSVHDCGEDRYEIRTVVAAPDVVREHWRVRGPRKDYEASTTLTRIRWSTDSAYDRS